LNNMNRKTFDREELLSGLEDHVDQVCVLRTRETFLTHLQ
jgi:hypothetical protein